ncbi:T-cell surface glycoprotein CD3 gamma chain-like [Phycodurus eques]|uniref:T-cell surface glycoprotein CD3 gamma chain-like n=1 Tax=Phycodurus eques TaxID=693459 RepID=UPI002ACD4A67|nr:T-cell surface glycoprotein CD3 gamma chain-like [Phycodurus eques]
MHNADDTMKGYTVLPSFFIVWTLTEFVWCDEGSKIDIVVKSGPGEITIICGQNKNVSKNDKEVTFPLKYKDENSGEYECVDKDHAGKKDGQKIFVKFRSCENCVELDSVTISGLAVGNLMATIVLGVAVYLVASQTHASVITSQHKSSDQRDLIPNDTKRSVPNDEYQELRHKGGRKEIYNTLPGK